MTDHTIPPVTVDEKTTFILHDILQEKPSTNIPGPQEFIFFNHQTMFSQNGSKMFDSNDSDDHPCRSMRRAGPRQGFCHWGRCLPLFPTVDEGFCFGTWHVRIPPELFFLVGRKEIHTSSEESVV